MKKFSGQGNEEKGKGSEKSVWAGKEQKAGKPNKITTRKRETKKREKKK